MKKLLLAFQFLTIIPVRTGPLASNRDIAGSSAFFVVVGLLQGLLIAAAAFFSGTVFHPELAIAIALLVLVLSNGGFHLDGLADTFDALAAKSSGDIRADREKRLSIMKGGTTGPIGVIAIMFALALKYLALKNISNLSYFTYYSSLTLMPVLPKWTMVISMYHAKAAREDGLGNIFINGTGAKEAAISTMILVILLALPEICPGDLVSIFQPLFYAVLLVTLYGLCRLWVNFFNKRFGGLTGDTVGAISEFSEVIFLFMVILWSRLFI